MAGCSRYPTKEPLRQTMMKNDPSTMDLEPGFNKYVDRAILADGTETGIIHCKDGSLSKFWFRSHHLCKDIGGTWFSMSDGKEVYMGGRFCCEVQLPDEQMKSLAELRKFIQEGDGLAP